MFPQFHVKSEKQGNGFVPEARRNLIECTAAVQKSFLSTSILTLCSQDEVSTATPFSRSEIAMMWIDLLRGQS